jgi:hypothetical protein
MIAAWVDPGGAHPLPSRVQFSMFVPLLLETPKKALGHCTTPKLFPRKGTRSLHKTKIFYRKKNAFLQLGNNVESYSQMPGN